MRTLKAALVAAAALGGLALATNTASAMPVGGLKAAADEVSTDLQNVVWICGPFRCWWRPVYYYPRVYYYPYYRPYYRPWGWRPYWGWGWRRWWW